MPRYVSYCHPLIIDLLSQIILHKGLETPFKITKGMFNNN